jgi:RNA recognition motif-containing protein
MIRGPIITEIEEEMLLNIFEAFAPIKDIRMIRNKLTGGNKDFAFI